MRELRETIRHELRTGYAEEHGLRVDVLAETSTVHGLVEALAAHVDSLIAELKTREVSGCVGARR